MAAPTAKVIRDGKEVEIPAARHGSGATCWCWRREDRVPADAQIVEAVLLQADEAMLSGESHPVNKTTLPQDSTQDTFRKRYGLYGNHNYEKGGERRLCPGTGMTTQMGQIAGMLDTIETERTPLQEKLGFLRKNTSVLVAC